MTLALPVQWAVLLGVLLAMGQYHLSIVHRSAHWWNWWSSPTAPLWSGPRRRG